MRNKLAAVAVASLLAAGFGVTTAGSASAATSPSQLCGGYSTSEPELSQDDSGDAVKALQCELYNSLAYQGPDVDGYFGPKTLAAVQKFQTCTGLKADGIVGPLTWAKLDDQANNGSRPVWC
ncbi:peptidoglycan-binding protein [Kitasatospora sp. NPDC056076]|uniref:peptidoglycan-binding domain-containing protein n=1 Tax=Kitasatospora sp. NPDC056076 TaxID=3345703 RepID=UPI0035DCE1D1